MKLLDSTMLKELRDQTNRVADKDACHERDGITATNGLPTSLEELDALIDCLQKQRTKDAERVVEGSRRVVELANSSSLLGAAGGARKTGRRELLVFQLKRAAGQRARLHFEYIAAAMLSRRCAADLQALNPHLDQYAASHELPRACASILLHTIRLCQVLAPAAS